jgi:PKD repeat protein
MKKTSLLLLAAIWCSLRTNAQTCTYLAYDGFDNIADAPLDGLASGTGWAAAWSVQNGDTNVPGYQVNNGSGSLSFGALQTMGRYAKGGYAYLSSGRRLAVGESEAFPQFVAVGNNGIGTLASGDTLWVSFLLQKDEGNDEEVWVDLHSEGAVPWYVGNPSAQHIAVGYFGSARSNVGGQRRWTLAINGAYYPTSVPVGAGTPAFMVLRLIFNDGDTNVALYANPATLGDNLPATPTMSQNTGENNVIRSVAAYLGDNAGSGAVDELRFATRYACVAPDNTISVNLPPTAVIVASPLSGQLPLTVNFDATSSFDPEGQPLSYTWDFGDGSPTASGSSVSHTYTNILGVINASLIVTDNYGSQNIDNENIVLLNENNTYPCQTSFSVDNMPSCGSNDGRITVNAAPGVGFELRNASNVLMPLTGGNQYEGLVPGVYSFTATGGTGGCTDTFQLHMAVDSTTCLGWQPDACSMAVGTNMSGFADWGVERPMKNLFKHVRPDPIPFTTTCYCWEVEGAQAVLAEMAFDTNGYPTHIPQSTSAGSNTVLRYVISSESPDGTNLQMGQQYVLLYDGAGTVNVGGGVSVSSSAQGRIQFNLTANNNIFIEILTATLGDHVRNIRLLRLADETADLGANPFYQGFLDKIAPFQMLRFMDWGHTNNNPLTNWANRSSTDYFTYATDAGVPYELMIQLANQMQKDVWICVPHAVDDNYIEQMAALFHGQLDPNLNIYLEYSNEVWNWIFDQAYFNEDNRPSNLNYARAYSERAKHTFQIWHDEFGAQSGRVKRVLGLQTTYSYLNEQILSQLDQSDWDYGAPTHYFGLNHEATGSPVLSASSTPQDIINNATNYWHTNLPLFKRDFDQIHLFGKEVITYEGGQHFVGNVFGIPYDYQQAMWDAQYTTGIYNLYEEVLDTIRAWGCKMAGNFSLATPQESVYGSWGVLNDIDDQPPYMTSAPKYQALLDAINYCPEDCPDVRGLNFAPLPPNTYRAQIAIVSLGVIANGTEVVFAAGDSVLLKPGFHAQAGADFRATIAACNDPLSRHPSNAPHDGGPNGRQASNDFPPARQPSSALLVFPNPMSGIATFRYALHDEGIVSAAIYDLAGRKCLDLGTWRASAGVQERTLLTSGLASGVYFLSFTSAMGRQTVKVVVNNE